MNQMSHSLTILLAILVFSSASCTAPQHDSTVPDISKIGLKNIHQPHPNISVSGQPSEEQLTKLARAGVKHIVNLRPESELDWNEKKKVEELGMRYVSIPVSGADDLSVEKARKLNAELARIGDEPALIHCASGNRVGALIAISEGKLNGKPTSDALSTGKEWGLTRLASAVEKKLTTPSPIQNPQSS